MKVVAIPPKKCYIILACMKYIEGVNTMNQIKILRRLAVFVLVIAGVLTLAACKSSDQTPYGSLTDNAYLTIGDITITEKELYDQLRMQGASVLANMIDEIIFEEHMTAVRTLLANGDEKLNKYLDETVNNAIHSTTDKENLQKLHDENLDRWTRNIERFADSLYLLDNTLNISNIITAIESLPTPNEGYASIPVLRDRYILRVAQYHYAAQILDEEVLDADNSNYITEAQMVQYYKANLQNRYDVDALVIRFINLNEANAALYAASIKSDSRGRWYKVPDIRITDSSHPGYVDLTDTSETGYAHVVTILNELNLMNQLDETKENRNLSVLDYENYYKKYIISTSRTSGRNDEPLTTAQVKEEFIFMYNLLNPTTKVEVALDGSIQAQVGFSFNPTLTFDELTKMNTSLRQHIYTNLTAEFNMEDPEEVSNERPYSSRVQTFGNSRYLVYKISDNSGDEEGILVEDPEDDTKEIFGSSQAALDIKAEVFGKLVQGKLINTYISNKVDALYKDMSLDIFDKVVRTFYEQSYGYDGTTKSKGGDILAVVNGTEITVDEFYAKLEKSYGINLSLDLASNKVLMASPRYSVSESEMTGFRTQFEEIISQFSADNFATAGFPASMGREKFLLLAFGSKTNTEAVNQLYVYPELRKQFSEDIEAHYGEDVYYKLADLSALHFDNFKSITVSHLLVYFDQNGDGTPDNPQTYLDSLSPAARIEVLEGLQELVAIVYEKVGNYSGLTAGLQAIANEFNNSGRILRGTLTNPIDIQIEMTWAKYRQLGFYLKFENIPSAITNKSNVITGQSVLDEVFYNRALQIHSDLEEFASDTAKFPHLDMYGTWISQSDLESVKSSFGWHFILATNVGSTTSAIFYESDDPDGRYKNEDGLNAYNYTSETLTASQISYYLIEQRSDEGVVLPTNVQTAVNNYLQPVMTRYNNTFMQRELIFQLLEDANFASSTAAARFETVRAINVRQLNEYLLSDLNNGVFDPNYDALFGSWFDILRG